MKRVYLGVHCSALLFCSAYSDCRTSDGISPEVLTNNWLLGLFDIPKKCKAISDINVFLKRVLLTLRDLKHFG